MAKVLVVEDDPLLSFGLTDEIEAAGHRVVDPAPSTGAALMQVRVEKPTIRSGRRPRGLLPLSMKLFE